MEKSLFEQTGGTYVRQGDYLIPCLTLPAEKRNLPIGIWGQRHARHLKQHHKVLYMNLLISGKLNSYLADIDEQAEDMFSQLVKEMADREGVTEQLKAENQLLWIRIPANRFARFILTAQQVQLISSALYSLFSDFAIQTVDLTPSAMYCICK